MSWTCRWCWRWNDDHEPTCAHCGRDIEAATWPRDKKGTGNE